MSDLKEVRLTGTVASFNNAVYTNNIEDEKHAVCRISINVSSPSRNSDGSTDYKHTDVYTVVAFGKTAQIAAKMAKPGAGLIIRAHLSPSVPMMSHGQKVVTSDGKDVYTGPQIIIDNYDGISFTRNYYNGNDNGNGGAAPAQHHQASQPSQDVSSALDDLFATDSNNSTTKNSTDSKITDDFDFGSAADYPF